MAAWEGSTRRETLPPDWPKRVAARRKKAATEKFPGGQCEKWIKSAVDGRWMRCPLAGDEVDHDNHRLDHDHLKLLCGRHHTEKTNREAQAARYRPRRRREPEAHPGTRGR